MNFQVFVWIYLPGDLEPMLGGRFEHQATAVGPLAQKHPRRNALSGRP